MESLLKSLRPTDYVLALAMVALAALLGYANVAANPNDSSLVHSLDSQSPLLIPVFILAALPILFRRAAVLSMIAISFVVVAASLPAFGYVTRCGFVLPLSAAFAYAVARFGGSRGNQILGLLGILALQVVTLLKDASAGLDGLVVGIPLVAVFYGIGLLVQNRAEKATRGATAPAATPAAV